MLRETDFVDYPITINPIFEKVYIYTHSATGFVAISFSCLVVYLVSFKSKFLGKEYMYCLLVLKLFCLLFDANSTIIFLPFVILPCKGFISLGLGHLIGISARAGLTICVSALSGICSWFNCCLFHRHQMIMPYDHALKLSSRKSLVVYFIMNAVMFINPLVFLFTSKNDIELQRPIIKNSSMSWLLDKPSFKIFTEDNTPAMMRFHFPYTMLTFALCTLTTTFLTRHSIRVMNSRRESISSATIALQERLINSLSLQMTVQSVGVSGPVVYWVICLFTHLITPEATAAVFLFLLITSIINSVYTIVSTKKYKTVMLRYYHSIFQRPKDHPSDSPQQFHRSVLPRASVVSQQFTSYVRPSVD